MAEELKNFIETPPAASVKIEEESIEEKQEEAQELTPSMAKAVRFWSKTWLDGFDDFLIAGELPKSGFDPIEQLELEEGIQARLAFLVGKSDENKQGAITKEQGLAVGIFIQELIDYIAVKAREENQEQLRRFIVVLDEALFSHSSGLLDSLPLPALLKATTKMNRLPPAQGFFGKHFVGHAVYSLKFCFETDAVKAADEASRGSVSETLDFIDQCQTIGAQAIGYGWVEDSLEKVVLMLKKIQEQAKSPLVEYAVALALERLGVETKDPSLGIFSWPSNRAEGRVIEPLAAEYANKSEDLLRRIRPDVPMPPAGAIMPVAKDALALADHANTPRYLAKVDMSRLPLPGPLSSFALERTRETVAADAIQTRMDVDQVIDYVNDKIIPSLPEGAKDNPDTAQSWFEISPVLDKEEWRTYLKSRQLLREGLGAAKEEEKNLAAAARLAFEQKADDFVKLFSQLAPDILERAGLPDDLTKSLRARYQIFLEYKQKQDEDGAYDAANRFTKTLWSFRYFGFQEEKTPKSDGVVRLLDAYQDHETAEENIEQTFTANRQAVYNERHEELTKQGVYSEENFELQKKLSANLPQFTHDLGRYIEALEAKLFPAETKVHFQSYENLPRDPEINPFFKSDQENTALLLQHLHRPALREKIEADLNVDLTSIPLRSQAHLLRFLAASEQPAFARLRSALAGAATYRPELLQSFFAVAEKEEYGEHILRIAEKAQPELTRAVFEKYGQIIDAGDSVADYLREYFKASQVDIGRIDGIRQHLVRKGNELLKHYSFQLEQADQRKQKGLSQTLLIQLEHVKINILLFAGAIKEMSSRQEITLENLEDIGETAIEIKDSSGLSAEERQEMMRIFEQNRLNVYPESLFAATRRLFQKTISEPGHEFHVLRHQGEITAFIRFDELPNGNVYAGSLNVRPEIRDSAIGSAMLSATLRAKASGRAVEAEAFAKLPALDRYLTVYGFRGVGIDESWQGTNELFFKLKIDENMSPDPLLASQNYEFDLDSQKQELVETIKPMLAQGWAIVGCKKKDRESNQATLTLQKFVARQAEAPAQEQE